MESRICCCSGTCCSLNLHEWKVRTQIAVPGTQSIEHNMLISSFVVDLPKFDLMTENLKVQCIWEDHPRNITALLSGYPQPSVSWSRGDGRAIIPGDSYKVFFEPYWENGRRDEWMANLEVWLDHVICVQWWHLASLVFTACDRC